MKKKFLYALMLFSGFSCISCSDDEKGMANIDREWMTMFICDNNRGKGDDYAYNCKAEGPNGNDIHLYWYGVNNCAGYQIRQALQPNVSGGADAWGTSAENGLLLLDTIVGPEVLDLVIKDQQYSTDYRFAIRVLSTKDDNVTDFSHASKWYGHGDGRQWAEWMGITTSDRYATPFCVYVDASKTTQTTMRVMLNRAFKTVTEGVSDDDKAIYREKFQLDANDNFVYQWLEVDPSPNNPESTVNEKWRKYKLTDEDFEKGYVDIDGLQKNSVYVINVRNENVKVKWDAYYNTCSARSDGEPGEPILVTHDLSAPSRDRFDSDEAYQNALIQHEAALKYNAMRIDFLLTDFISDVNLAEGQTYYLEGGKTYCMFDNLTTCKGFVLRTRPEDVAAGKRAKVLLGGMHMTGTNVNSMNLMFGRQPQAGVSPLDGLRAVYGDKVAYAKGYAAGRPMYGRADEIPQNVVDSLRAEAVEMAKKADLVVLVGGLNKNHFQDCEGGDRLEYGLPFGQDELIEALLGVNKNLVLVLLSGNAVEMPWVSRVPAIVQGWYLGSMGGKSLADILSGAVNPSGKLPFSFPAKLTDCGAYAFDELSYPGDSIKQEYKEDILVGYRWHDTKEIPALFPFGHGLSYTTFTYGKPVASAKAMAADGTLTVTVAVKNTGSIAGKEIVQLYVGDDKCSVLRPVKELKHFAKVGLAPGEEKSVTFTLTPDDLKFYDEASAAWKYEPGKFKAYVCASSADVRGVVSFEMQ